MFERVVEIAQGFLHRAFGNLISPGNFCFLEGVEFTMQIDCRGHLLTGFVSFLLATETVVIRIASGPAMFASNGDLFVIQVQLGAIAMLLAHSSSSAFM